MIAMGAVQLTREEMECNVAKLCEKYGTVRHIVVITGERADFAIAGVEMSTRSETWEIARRFGDSISDTMAMITIQ